MSKIEIKGSTIETELKQAQQAAQNAFDEETAGMSDDQRKMHALRKDAERLRQRKLGDLRKVLELPEGRRFVWDTMSACGIFRSSYVPNSDETQVNEGKRKIGLGLLENVFESAPSAFAQMQREHFSEVRGQEARSDKAKQEQESE